MTANARPSSPKVEPLSGTVWVGTISVPGFGGGVPVITEGVGVGVPEGDGVGVPDGVGVGVPEGDGVGVPDGVGVGVPEGVGVGVPDGGCVTMSAIPEKLNRKLLGWRFPLPTL